MFVFLQTDFNYIYNPCTVFLIIILLSLEYNYYCINLFLHKHLFLHTIIPLVLLSPAFNCGDPGTLTNGRRRLTNSTTVKYTCDTGYRLSGASTRFCTANNREWTGSVPQCIRELRATTIHQIDRQIDKRPVKSVP